MTRRISRRPLAVATLLVLAAVLVAVVFAPSILGALGRAWLARLVERSVEATVTVDRLDLSFSGQQAVRGLTLRDAGGGTVAEIDVDVRGGLLAVATGTLDACDVRVAGHLRGHRAPDGSLSFVRMRTDRDPDGASASAMPSVPVSVRIDGLEVTVHDDAGGREVSLDGLAGTVDYTPGATIEVKLDGTSRSGTAPGAASGAVHLTGTVTGLFDAKGTLTPKGATTQVDLQCASMPLAFQADSITVGDLNVTVRSDDLSAHAVTITAHGDAAIEDAPGELSGEIRIDDPFAVGASGDSLIERLSGRLSGQNVASSLLQPVFAGTDLVVERDLGPTVDFECTLGDGARRALTVTGSTARTHLEVQGVVDTAGNVLRVSGGTATIGVTPSLIAAIAGEMIASALTLDAEDAVRLTLDPAELRLATGPEDHAVQGAVGFGVAIDDVRLTGTKTPGETVTVSGLGARGKVTFGAKSSLSIDGNARLLNTSTGARLGDATFRLANAPGGATYEGKVDLQNVDVPALETVLAVAPGRLTEWLGPAGAVTITLGPAPTDGARELDVDVAFDHVKTRLELALGDDAIEARSDSFPLTLAPARVHSLLFGDTPAGSGAVSAPLPLSVSIDKFRLPYAALDGGSSGGSPIAVDVRMTGGPLTVTKDDKILTIDGIEARASGEDCGRETTFSLKSRVGMTGSGDPSSLPGSVDIQGKLTGLRGSGATDAGGGAQLDVTIAATDIPTILADTVAELDGLLLHTLGPVMSARVESRQFSANSGRLEGEVTLPHGRVEVHLEGHGGRIVTPPDKPLRGQVEASPALGAGFLSYIHPALGDIVRSEKPIQITLSNLSMPWPDQPIAFDGDLEIVIGRAEFKPSSAILAPLAMFQNVLDTAAGGKGQSSSAGPTVPGSVEPIQATVRHGVVTYERFVIEVGNQRLEYTGTVDLVQRTLDIRTEVPIKALDLTDLLAVVPTGIRVPVRSHGTFESIKTDVEVGRLAGQVPEAVLSPILNIFGGKKKKDGE